MKYSQSLCALNLFQAESEIDKLVENGLDHIHLDLVDYHYAKSFGLNFQTIEYITNKYPKICYDIHAMVDDIESMMPQIAQMNIQRVSFPMDRANVKLINNLRHLYQNIEFGIMIEAHNSIDFELIKYCDFVVLMTINKIGGTGQKLNVDLLEKVKLIKQKYQDLLIISDGGLRSENLHMFKDAQIDVAVGGSIIFNYPNSNTQSFMDYWNSEVNSERNNNH